VRSGSTILTRLGHRFQLKKGQEAKDACTKALEIDDKSVKAYFRRGCAWLAMNEADKAEADLKKAEELDPNDAAIKKELKGVAALRAKNKKAESNFAKKMFG
jgi:tetratricopeptide (TPR) repeat protein